MKHYISSFASYLATLSIVPLLFWSCGTEELESPFQEVEKLFDQVADLPDLEDPDPEITEPVYQEMSNSPLVANLLEEIVAYEEEGKSISENARKELDKLKLGLEAMGVNLNELGNFESSYPTGILESEAHMDEELEGLMAEFMKKHELTAPLLEIPEVTISPSLESLRSKSKDKGKDKGKKGKGKDKDNQEEIDIFGPCFERAREAYELRITKLEDQYNTSVDRINENFLRRIEAAKKRLENRNKEVDKHYQEKLKSANELTSEILGKAKMAGRKGNKELDKDLKVFSLIFSYHIREQLVNWYKSSRAFNENYFNEEIEKIERLRDEQLSRVLESYEKALGMAARLLNKAFDRCHNQGGGH